MNNWPRIGNLEIASIFMDQIDCRMKDSYHQVQKGLAENWEPFLTYLGILCLFRPIKFKYIFTKKKALIYMNFWQNGKVRKLHRIGLAMYVNQDNLSLTQVLVRFFLA